MSSSEKAPEWQWLSPAIILEMHREQLAEHGGIDGVRDETALQSAFARPQNLAYYGTPDAAALAAAYAYGIARNHAFLDGNKRSGWISALAFLERNGYALTVPEAEAIGAMLALAAGELAEDAFAAWLRARISPNE